MLRPLSVALAVLALAGCGVTYEPGDEDGATADADAANPPDVAETDAEADAAGTDTGAPDATATDVPRQDARTDATAGDAPRDGTARDVAVDAPRMDAALDAPRMDAARGDGGARCPEEMVLVDGRVCIDRWEAAVQEVDMDGGVRDWSPHQNVDGRRVRAVSRPGVSPQAYISGAQAEAACVAAGKRLCALSEWLAACRGPRLQTYPYGNTYVRRRCNEARTPHPVVQYFGTSMGVFTYANMNNPGINMQADTVGRTGQFADCVSPWGVYDLVGNLHEWIADRAGTFKGGFYVDAEINGRGCLYTTTAHGYTYHDYSTGFRCCADPR